MGSASRRREWKLRLIRRLYGLGFERQDVVELFRLIDWMMVLPQDEERLFQAELERIEKESQMPYLSSIERLAKEDGHKEGLLQGRQEGLDLLSRVLVSQLTGKFGTLPSWAKERVASATATQLERWAEAFTSADSLDDLLGT